MKVVPMIHLVLGVGLCLGCDVQKKIDEVRQDFKKELEETRKVAKEAIRAVPGERYLQLIDDLNSQDKDRIERAQAFLRSLAHIDRDVEYEVSVWFELSPMAKVRADIFRAATPDRVEVEKYTKGKSLNLRSITSSAASGITQEELRARMQAQLEEFTNMVLGAPEKKPLPGQPPHTYRMQLHWRSELQPEAIGVGTENPGQASKQLDAAVEETMKRRAELARKTLDAILLQYGLPLVPPADIRLKKPWSPFDGRQFLVVVLPKREWEELSAKKQLAIRCLVHSKSDPATAFPGSDIYTFSLSEFSPSANTPLPHPIPGESDHIVWAVHNMTDASPFSTETLHHLREARRIIKEWDDEAKTAAETRP